MKIGKETRWSLLKYKNQNWAVGPSKTNNVILVKINDNQIIQTVYSGGDVDNWCEATGDGKYIVYDDGSDIYITSSFSNQKGVKISDGQNCRPCAAPKNIVAWLPSPHLKYKLYDHTGKFLFDLNAPKAEEIYRLNWSNHNNFAVHMYGSSGNTKMNIRRINDGKHIFIGYGWDPDLWLEIE